MSNLYVEYSLNVPRWFQFSGFTTTITGSHVATNLLPATWTPDGDFYGENSNTNIFTRFHGFTETIKSTASHATMTPVRDASWHVTDGDALFSDDLKVYKWSGYTGTLVTSLTHNSEAWYGYEWEWSGDTGAYVYNNTLSKYVHTSGFTTTISNSFAAPAGISLGLAIDADGNMLSDDATYSATIVGEVIKFSGFSSTILTSIQTNLYSGSAIADDAIASAGSAVIEMRGYARMEANPAGSVHEGIDGMVYAFNDGQQGAEYTQGFTSTILDSAYSPANVYGTDFKNGIFYVNDGVTHSKYQGFDFTWVLDYYPVGSLEDTRILSYQMVLDESGNVIHCKKVSTSDTVIRQSGFSSTINSSFFGPIWTNAGLDWRDNNLRYQETFYDETYEMAGFTSTITTSLSLVNDGDITSYYQDLIGSNTSTHYITRYSGFTTTIVSSYLVASTEGGYISADTSEPYVLGSTTQTGVATQYAGWYPTTGNDTTDLIVGTYSIVGSAYQAVAYWYDGFSTTLVVSSTLNTNDVGMSSVVWLEGDICLGESRYANKLDRYLGFTATIKDSIAGISPAAWTGDGSVMLNFSSPNYYITKYTGFTSTINTSASLGTDVYHGLTWDYTNNRSIVGNVTAGRWQAYTGISSTLDSYLSVTTVSNQTNFAWDQGNVVGNQNADTTLNRFEGFTTTVIDTAATVISSNPFDFHQNWNQPLGYVRQIVTNGFPSNVAGSSTSHTLQFALTPKEGDLLLLFCATDGGSETITVTGFTSVTGDISDGSCTGNLFWKKATAADAATPVSYSASIGSAETMYAQMIALDGELYDNVSPVDAYATSTGSGTAVTCPTATMAGADTLVLRLFACDHIDAQFDAGFPAGVRGLFSRTADWGAGGVSAGGGWHEPGAGATGTADFTLSAAEGWASFTVGIKRSARTVQTATATMVATGSTGITPTLGNTTQQGIATQTVVGNVDAVGITTQSAIATLTATGVLDLPGSTTQQGVATQVATAVLEKTGVITQSAIATMVANGQVEHAASTTQQGIATQVASAIANYSAAAVQQAIATLNANATADYSGSITQSAIATLVASGQVGGLITGTTVQTGTATQIVSANVDYSGAVIYQGLATQVGNAVVTYAGAVIQQGIATQVSAAVADHQGTTTQTGLATQTVTANIDAVGATTQQGIATLVATGSTLGTVLGTTIQTGTATLQATAQADHVGATSQTGVATQVATGGRIVTGQCIMTATATQVAAPVKIASASISLSAVATLVATGRSQIAAVAVMSATGTQTAIATKQASATLIAQAVATQVANAQADHTGNTIQTGTATVVATGQIQGTAEGNAILLATATLNAIPTVDYAGATTQQGDATQQANGTRGQSGSLTAAATATLQAVPSAIRGGQTIQQGVATQGAILTQLLYGSTTQTGIATQYAYIDTHVTVTLRATAEMVAIPTLHKLDALLIAERFHVEPSIQASYKLKPALQYSYPSVTTALAGTNYIGPSVAISEATVDPAVTTTKGLLP